MKEQNPIEKILSAKLPEMDPSFRNKLRGRLADLAEIQMGEKPSVFHPLFLNMKRNSVVYFSVLVLLVFSISMVLPKSLTAPEVLAQVAENYEKTGDIYHEKIVHSRFEGGQLVEASMDETYYDERGNYLGLIKNPDTEEILSVNLEIVDEYGDINIYDSSDMNLTGEQSADQQAWYETFRGEKVYCTERVGEDVEVQSLSVLSLAADDYSVYQVTGESLDSPSQDSDDLSLWDLTSREKGSAESYVQQLIDAGSYDYEELEENGVSYHVFKMALAPYDEQEGEGGRVLWFYIDTGTFQLVRYDIHFKFNPERVDQNLVLESGYIQSDAATNVFDPSQYGDLELSYLLSASLPFTPDSDGCYDWQGNALDDSILNEIPESALEEWHSLSALILEVLEESHRGDPFPVHDQVELPLDSIDVTLPSRGLITQLYTTDHLGWDFSSAHSEDDAVYAPLDATVLEVSEGTWNGGNGNSILLSHVVNGVEFQTYYAHLDEIEVAVGQTLKQGDTIGTMGQTGRVAIESTSVLLHFELRFEDIKLDPAQLFELD